MSFNARWRGSRIVVSQNLPLEKPSQKKPDRNKELVGGLKNALERGETIQKAKQTFLNAGYTSEEIESASRNLSPIPSQNPKDSNLSQPSSSINSLPITSKSFKKQTSKKLIILLVVVMVTILISAAVIGIYWNSWF